MFFGRINKVFRSFAFYLCLGYLVVYALCTVSIYVLASQVITKSARGYDRQDVTAESEELVELIQQSAGSNLLAEQVTMERYPPSTIFIVRVINRRGQVEYTMTWPKKIDLPDWRVYTPPQEASSLPPAGLSEYYIKPLGRHIQIQTTLLEDGRVLQVGKGSFLEVDQKSMLARMLLVFALLSTLFSVLSGIFMMVITLRPIHHITDSMSHIIETGAFETGAPPVKSLIAELDTLGRLFTIVTEKYANLIQAMRQTMDNIAHDFRTPLTRIRGAAELALNHRDLPQDVSDTLADIIEDCDSAKLQLQNLMDAREMESGFVRLNIRPFNLTKLIDEIVDLYTLVAEEKEISLKTDLPTADMLVRGDRPRLVRVFANLIDNAIKYTPQRGSVIVSFTADDTGITTCVRDTGIGIPQEELALIWQRLFRGQQAREAEKGLGLGLNIVQAIVAAHGGKVWADSTSGQGTAFYVTLPRHP
ncbi:MAG: HAMP domain-containing histidine kinase [Kiritimatiellae bacterium]|jgi:signal transduction histidine kinase|nr:HAMP domain-containing histidine kinase [Kiritimatiellia bacterium]MDD2348622.1 HAMP domain-containing sensor histidine kinase [Kiritimatiellia bacterium]MDD3582802.1 HAMP domain-containing sensor histidine kinase [Kiritimatiellia bacterium]HHU15600.1 HAMP domain-containing histidine kinase [Lentisphaerota bacterium]HON47856.1 HAMP domain-containing sensor histidine kinase [Kiritimatiellia bacterium]